MSRGQDVHLPHRLPVGNDQVRVDVLTEPFDVGGVFDRPPVFEEGWIVDRHLEQVGVQGAHCLLPSCLGLPGLQHQRRHDTDERQGREDRRCGAVRLTDVAQQRPVVPWTPSDPEQHGGREQDGCEHGQDGNEQHRWRGGSPGQIGHHPESGHSASTLAGGGRLLQVGHPWTCPEDLSAKEGFEGLGPIKQRQDLASTALHDRRFD